MKAIKRVVAEAEATALRAHEVFADGIELPEPFGTLRRYNGDVLAAQEWRYRPEPRLITWGPGDELGDWAVALACQRYATYHPPQIEKELPASEEVRTQLRVAVYDMTPRALDPLAAPTCVMSGNLLDLLVTIDNDGTDPQRQILVPGCSEETLRAIYSEQELCLGWLTAAAQAAHTL